MEEARKKKKTTGRTGRNGFETKGFSKRSFPTLATL